MPAIDDYEVFVHQRGEPWRRIMNYVDVLLNPANPSPADWESSDLTIQRRSDGKVIGVYRANAALHGLLDGDLRSMNSADFAKKWTVPETKQTNDSPAL